MSRRHIVLRNFSGPEVSFLTRKMTRFQYDCTLGALQALNEQY